VSHEQFRTAAHPVVHIAAGNILTYEANQKGVPEGGLPDRAHRDRLLVLRLIFRHAMLVRKMVSCTGRKMYLRGDSNPHWFYPTGF